VTDFLAREFPQITLADESGKLAAITALEESWSFAATHSAVGRLLQFDDFSDEQVQRILRTFTDNDQVGWILGDEDVSALAKKVLALVNTEEAAILSSKVTDMMSQFGGAEF
jgi:hypothetical protein